MTKIMHNGLIVVWIVCSMLAGPAYARQDSTQNGASPSKAYVDSANEQLRTEIANLRVELENAYKTITILQDRIAENTDRLKSICSQKPDLCR